MKYTLATSLLLAGATARTSQYLMTEATNSTKIEGEHSDDDHDHIKPWKEKMNCGQCIRNGYNFCYKGQDGARWSLNSKHSERKCCLDETCEYANDPEYSCSYMYTDQVYALTMCPNN